MWDGRVRLRLHVRASFQVSQVADEDNDDDAVWRLGRWFAGAHRLAAREENEALDGAEDAPRSEADVERDEDKAERG